MCDVDKPFLPKRKGCLAFHGDPEGSKMHRVAFIFRPVLVTFQLYGKKKGGKALSSKGFDLDQAATHNHATKYKIRFNLSSVLTI